MHAFNVVVDKLNRMIILIIVPLFTIMSAVTLIQVLFRYVFKLPLSWTEELARFLFVWVVFLGSAVSVKELAHVGVGYFLDRLSFGKKKVITVIAYSACIFMALILAKVGWDVTRRTFAQLAPSMQIPMAYVYLAYPLGFLLSAVNFAYHLLCAINQKATN
ncbi:MAG: TRAP-type transport system small permease protein [Synergistaceae bacterium]|nr:TRAP-type transport system small permease protein [Synergistaceae bacterium]